MTAHGGSPIPNITSPRVSSDADQTPKNTPPGPKSGGAEDKNDVDIRNNKRVIIDFPAVQSLLVPTIEGFRSYIIQLNPRLKPALIYCLVQQQNRRYNLDDVGRLLISIIGAIAILRLQTRRYI
jgi:hypothetical protein